MATHSCMLAWRMPWTEDPGRLLENAVDRGPWQATDHGVAKRGARLSVQHSTVLTNDRRPGSV